MPALWQSKAIISHGVKLIRWERACAREQWETIPVPVAQRLTATGDKWRHHVGLRKRADGQVNAKEGTVPTQIESMLDSLIGGSYKYMHT